MIFYSHTFFKFQAFNQELNEGGESDKHGERPRVERPACVPANQESGD